MIILPSVLVAIIGLLMFALSVNAKLVEVGKISFGCGLLAALLGAGPQLTRLFGSGG